MLSRQQGCCSRLLKTVLGNSVILQVTATALLRTPLETMHLLLIIASAG